MKIYICKVTEVENAIDGTYTVYNDILKDEVVIIKTKDTSIKIFSNVCPHMAGLLKISKDKEMLICTWHGLKFEMTGKVTNCKAKLKLLEYQTSIENELIFINI